VVVDRLVAGDTKAVVEHGIGRGRRAEDADLVHELGREAERRLRLAIAGGGDPCRLEVGPREPLLGPVGLTADDQGHLELPARDALGGDRQEVLGGGAGDRGEGRRRVGHVELLPDELPGVAVAPPSAGHADPADPVEQPEAAGVRGRSPRGVDHQLDRPLGVSEVVALVGTLHHLRGSGNGGQRVLGPACHRPGIGVGAS
jgi:hypothetical protein